MLRRHMRDARKRSLLASREPPHHQLSNARSAQCAPNRAMYWSMLGCCGSAPGGRRSRRCPPGAPPAAGSPVSGPRAPRPLRAARPPPPAAPPGSAAPTPSMPSLTPISLPPPVRTPAGPASAVQTLPGRQHSALFPMTQRVAQHSGGLLLAVLCTYRDNKRVFAQQPSRTCLPTGISRHLRSHAQHTRDRTSM